MVVVLTGDTIGITKVQELVELEPAQIQAALDVLPERKQRKLEQYIRMLGGDLDHASPLPPSEATLPEPQPEAE